MKRTIAFLITCACAACFTSCTTTYESETVVVPYPYRPVVKPKPNSKPSVTSYTIQPTTNGDR